MSNSFVAVSNASVKLKQRPSGFFSRSNAPSVPVLKNINFGVDQGEIVTVYGHAGSGKSTLLQLLTGVLQPTTGSILVNNKTPQNIKNITAGYVSPEENESTPDTVHETLKTFADTHGILAADKSLADVISHSKLRELLHRPTNTLSTSQRMSVNLARAALSDSPLVLLDDVADIIGVEHTKQVIRALFPQRTILIATRNASIANDLDTRLLLLHRGRLAHQGTCDSIANDVTCPRIVDAWVEGMNYGLLKKLRAHEGVNHVRLLPTDSLKGQRLRITLHSGRYLPSFYDLLSTAPLVKVEEIPSSLVDIIERLP